jgi:hypothetical protein
MPRRKLRRSLMLGWSASGGEVILVKAAVTRSGGEVYDYACTDL